MGEEKPEEELMGKRKSSPRLPNDFNVVDSTYSCPESGSLYAPAKNFFDRLFGRIGRGLFSDLKVW
jgi:predicted secreted protein